MGHTHRWRLQFVEPLDLPSVLLSAYHLTQTLKLVPFSVPLMLWRSWLGSVAREVDFHVEITEIHSTLVDSTEALVAYSSSMAVFDAFQISVEPMTLDMRTRAVTITPFTAKT